MMKVVPAAFVVVLCLYSPCRGWAESPPFETPSSEDFVIFEPMSWRLGYQSRVEETAESQHYVAHVYRDDDSGLNPVCTVARFAEMLERGVGVLYVSTHGTEGCFLVEAYERTVAGLAARDEAYARYLDEGWLTSDIYPSSGADHYGISITGFGVMRHFNDRNSIVYFAGCHTCTSAFGFQGAREILCYDDVSYNIQLLADADLFWFHMNGEACRVCRTVKVAAMMVDEPFRHWRAPPGNETTVLSPAVCRSSLSNGDHLRTLTDEWFAFDTHMDTGDARLLYTEGPARVGDMEWRNDTCLVFQTAPIDTGFCGICISAGAKSAGGRPLDGNADPPGMVGCGPNGDPHCIPLYAVPDDAATRWGALWAFESAEGVQVEWTTEVERGSRHFDVLGIGELGPKRLARVPAHGSTSAPAFYSVVVPGGCSRFMVSEVDTGGVSMNSRPFGIRPEPPAHRKLARRADRLAGDESSSPQRECVCSSGRGGRTRPGSKGVRSGVWPEYVFYGPDSLLAELSPLVGHWSDRGIESDLQISTDSDP